MDILLKKYHHGMQSLYEKKNVAFDRHVFVVIFCVFAWYSVNFPAKEIHNICMEVIINVVQ